MPACKLHYSDREKPVYLRTENRALEKLAHQIKSLYWHEFLKYRKADRDCHSIARLDGSYCRFSDLVERAFSLQVIMGMPSTQASNAVIYVTYGLFLLVGVAIAWTLRKQSKTDYLSSNRTQKGPSVPILLLVFPANLLKVFPWPSTLSRRVSQPCNGQLPHDRQRQQHGCSMAAFG